MEEKKREKYLQTRYRRELERYLNRLVGFAQRGEGGPEAYRDYVEKMGARLEEVEKVPLYNDYYERLERFVEMSRQMAESGLERDEIDGRILHEANQIRKSRRIKSYKRSRKKEDFEEDY